MNQHVVFLSRFALGCFKGVQPLLWVIFIAACGGGGGKPAGTGASHPDELDLVVLNLTESLALTGDPAAKRGLEQVRPDQDPLVRLGQSLFFSQSLSGGFDVACATCHLPDLGGSDGLSLSVGVVPLDRHAIGLARRIDPLRDRDPLADGGPNMHRNSITTFNAALFDRQMMFDGRIRVHEAEPDTFPSIGQHIITPETSPNFDSSGVSGLLAITSKFPITNNNEMRGFYYADISNHDDFRRHLVARLKGTVDQDYMSENAEANWLGLFRSGFGSAASADDLITLPNIQRALGRFVESQIFVDTPWRSYLAGHLDAITDDAKRGALLFYTPLEEDGLGCVACHSGDRFTDERFYNAGFPQIGRGFQRSDRLDVGRWQVTRASSDWFAFRTPSLLNIDLTAPYGHAGTFASLEALIAYHVEPDAGFAGFDFSLQQLPQFAVSPVSYEQAATNTGYIFEYDNFSLALSKLPRRALTEPEMADLIAFLRALTDVCAGNVTCRAAWLPDPAMDPDGHQLGALNGPAPIIDGGSTTPDDYPDEIAMNFPVLAPISIFPEADGACPPLAVTNNGTETFVRRDVELGLTAVHGFDLPSWSYEGRGINVEATMAAGGVTSAYLDDDCWPDLIMTGGDVNGLVAYRNLGGGNGFSSDDSLLGSISEASTYRRVTAVGVADLNGDYRRELVLGNLYNGNVYVLSENSAGDYVQRARLPMTRSTFGISFADYDMDGYLDMALGHWDADGVDGAAPAFWKGTGQLLLNWEDEARLGAADLDQKWNFTPKFGDFRRVGRMDLVVASDFGTSAVFKNSETSPDVFQYRNVTDRDTISDENGMGAALGDIDNDGRLDWFVTSVRDMGLPEANWGVTGNRLYRNVSSPLDLSFEDVTRSVGVEDGGWGWGACMADFNNDGFLDIFHVNGFGYIPEFLRAGGFGNFIDQYAALTTEFRGAPPRLFVNNGDGTFVDQAAAWGINIPSEGRGVTCFDYDRDGDIDIALLDHSRGIQFFENRLGASAQSRYLSIKLVGKSPNTDAVGARVYTLADLGGSAGLQRQVRMSEANSNYNSQNIPDLHFGLGRASSVTSVRIEWPDNTGLICFGMAVDQHLVFDQRDVRWPKLDPSAPLCTWYPNIGEIAFELLE